MKLAEALVIRSDLQNKISELETRLENNATVQDGEKPAEDPKELLSQLDRALEELEQFICRINLTNAAVQNDGKTMTELLAKRDCLKRRLGIMRDFLDCASIPTHRTRANEIIIRSSIPVSEIQKSVDKQSAELRRLELDIQALNWSSDLME
ncbi:DIP1984 family protein [Anaerotignum sp.]|uniref:DIP1984 family protein n=1 Tax=Anaerotignum sp. TaxID=2039241 RepID=UPI0028B073AC|nr:DIP1984 family protein [Anaerotignum sp.]